MNTVFLTYPVLCGLFNYIHQCVFNSLVASTFDGRVQLSDSPYNRLCKLMDNVVRFRSLFTKLVNELNRRVELTIKGWQTYANRKESILQRPREFR